MKIHLILIKKWNNVAQIRTMQMEIPSMLLPKNAINDEVVGGESMATSPIVR